MGIVDRLNDIEKFTNLDLSNESNKFLLLEELLHLTVEINALFSEKNRSFEASQAIEIIAKFINVLDIRTFTITSEYVHKFIRELYSIFFTEEELSII